MDYQSLSDLVARCGFTATAPLDVSTIELKSDVRKMCEENTCGMYDRCWSCPPGCGSLEECTGKLRQFTRGILVQTCGEVEDSFDFEAMAEIKEDPARHYDAMYQALRQQGARVLALSAGGCTTCAKCTYPDAPCRFPDKMVSSMEAYGMVVLEVCKANGLQYYYGSDKMAYTGCFLVDVN